MNERSINTQSGHGFDSRQLHFRICTFAHNVLNIISWSPNYQEFVDRAHLQNTRKGFGLLPSWPTQLPVLLTPIDHILVSNQIQVKNMRLGDNVGLAHLPVVADLAY